MHDIHHTDALVLSGLNVGEGSRYLNLLTRDLGLVRAHARSAREEKSKLRYGLQELMYARVALVRGRDAWRVTGTHEHWSVHAALSAHPDDRALALRLVRLVDRLVVGEEASPALFGTLEHAFGALASRAYTRREHAALEAIVVLRILYVLGYVDKEAQNAVFTGMIDTLPEITEELLRDSASKRARMVATINASLAATGL